MHGACMREYMRIQIYTYIYVFISNLKKGGGKPDACYV